jgi:hypothetical protein
MGVRIYMGMASYNMWRRRLLRELNMGRIRRTGGIDISDIHAISLLQVHGKAGSE